MTVDIILDFINLKIEKNDFKGIDFALGNVIPENEPTVNLLAWIRGTYPFRSKLPNWQPLLTDLREEIGDEKLKGLI